MSERADHDACECGHGDVVGVLEEPRDDSAEEVESEEDADAEGCEEDEVGGEGSAQERGVGAGVASGCDTDESVECSEDGVVLAEEEEEE